MLPNKFTVHLYSSGWVRLLKWNREKEEKPILLNNKNIFFSFYTWPKTINAATSLLYCRFVHGTVHINICSLFTPHTAAFSTVLYSSPRLFWLSLLSGKERKREKEEGRGRGKYFPAEIGNFLSPLYCTYCNNSQYILGLHLTIT